MTCVESTVLITTLGSTFVRHGQVSRTKNSKVSRTPSRTTCNLLSAKLHGRFTKGAFYYTPADEFTCCKVRNVLTDVFLGCYLKIFAHGQCNYAWPWNLKFFPWICCPWKYCPRTHRPKSCDQYCTLGSEVMLYQLQKLDPAESNSCLRHNVGLKSNAKLNFIMFPE